MKETAIGIPPGTPVLVTGATGFTGTVLTRKLVNAGCKVKAIARPSSDMGALSDMDIEWIRGDVFDEETVSKAAADVEYIFHVAAAFREPGVSDDVYHQVHVRGTQLLAKEVAGRKDFKRFIHVSTIGVHSHIENPPADENYPFNPDDLYQQTKAEAETWLHEFAKESGLRYVVIRPAAIFGPDDWRLVKFFRMISKGYLLLLGKRDTCYHLTHVEDLTNVIILAATHPAAEGEVFICGNDEPVSFERMGEIIAETYGKKLRVIRCPAKPFFLAATLCEAVCRPLGVEPPLYRRRVAFFTKNRAFSIAKLHEKLGYDMQYTNETGLAETAKRYLDKGWVKLSLLLSFVPAL